MTSRLLTITLALAGAVAFATPAFSDPRDGVFETSRDGTTLVHKASGMRFPKEVAGFRRTGDAVFDSSGAYVGIRYIRSLGREGLLELRIAVVHIVGMSPREHYAIAKPIALRGVANVHTIAEGIYARSDAGSPGYRGLFQGRDGDQSKMIGLWAFDRGYWDLRMRAEAPISSRLQAERAIGNFVAAFRGLDQVYKAP
jgi:hypothetical protein